MHAIRPSLCLTTLGLAALLLSGCQTPPAALQTPPVSAAQVGEFWPGTGLLKGYLDTAQLPNSRALLAPAPAPGSAQAAADLQVYDNTRALRNTPRWALAVRDAELRFPAAAETFSCALGVAISEANTPHLNMLLQRTLTDASRSTDAAKETYQRVRPFAALLQTSCTPAEETALAKNGSYPSGHAAIGWAWAQVLAGLAPEQAQQLLARGQAFGESRVICGVHWQSDVEAGRIMGAATVARLHADASFTAQAALAKAEIGNARAKGWRPRHDCLAEAAALMPQR